MNLSDGNNGTGTITLGGGGPATLQFIGSNDGTSRGINLVGDATLDASGTSTDRTTISIWTAVITGNGHNLTLTGTSSLQGGEFGGHVNLGSGSLTKTGSGLWALDVASTMGGLTVNGGNLILMGRTTFPAPRWWRPEC